MGLAKNLGGRVGLRKFFFFFWGGEGSKITRGPKFFYKMLFFGEVVRTTKITTSKTKKNSENSVDDQNIEKIY
jgi:hypothetical protein